MSRGAAVGVLGMGVTYLGALAIAQVALFVVAAAVVAIVVTIGVISISIMAWVRYLREAYIEQDYGWTRDLLLAPAVGLVAASVFSYNFATWMLGVNSSEFLEQLRVYTATGFPLLLKIVAVPVLGIAFFAVLFYIPTLLGRRNALRLLAYPGFVLFSVYLTGLTISYSNGWMGGW